MNRYAVSVILGAELRAWWNQASRRRRGRTIALAAVVLFGTVAFGAAAFTGGIAAAQYLPQARDAVLAGAFTGLAVLMLLLGFPTVIGNFFVGSNLLQLVLAPVRSVDIFVARSLLAVRTNVFLAGLVFAFLSGLGLGSGASPVYFLIALLLLFAQALAVTALQVILMAAVLRFVPARIARDVAAAVAGIAGAGLYLLWNINLRSSFGRRGAPDVSGLITFASRVDWLPSAWAGHALGSVIAGDAAGTLGWLTLFVALAAILTATAAALYGRTLLAGLGLLGATPTLWRRRQGAAETASREVAGAASPALAIARKDWLAYRRDLRRLSRILPGILFLLVYAFVLVRPARGAGQFWSYVLLTAFISMFLATAIAISSVPGERRGYQLLRMAPITTWEILRAKILYTLSPVVGLTVVLSVVVSAAAGVRLGQVAEIGVVALWLGFGFVAIGVSAGAIDPRFEAVDDRRSVGVGGTFAALVAELAFGVSSVGALALVQFSFSPPSFLPSLPLGGPVLALVAIPFAAIALGVVWTMLWLAAGRLRTFEGAIGNAA